MSSANSPECPLCESNGARVIGALEMGALRRQWAMRMQIDIGAADFDRIELLECANCQLKYFWPQWIGDAMLYEQLAKYEWYYLTDKEEYHIVRSILEKADSVLEIGAGRGALARKYSMRRYVGLELNAEAAREAQDDGYDVRNTDLMLFAKDNVNTYECVCMFQVLEHVADVNGILKCCLGCLKDGGKLIVSVPNDDSFIGMEVNNVLNMPPHHATRWNAATFPVMAQMYGLTIGGLYEERLADYHIRNYARCVSSRGLARVLRRGSRLLDGMAGSLIWRGVSAMLGMPIEMALKCGVRQRPKGHSIVAVLCK